MLFTIITPCYNSSESLRRTYESLLAQTSNDFEWILIDDYSNDDGATRNLIQQLISEAPFPIKYFFLEKNYFASKSVAKGCQLASGQYACILDHDDQLVPDALAIVKGYLAEYTENLNIIGVCGRCVDENGALIGKKFQQNEQVTNEGDIRFKQRITSELFQFTRIDILQVWFEKMKPGYTNGFVWAKISIENDYIFVNDVLRIYDTSLPTSYSNSQSVLSKFPEARANAMLETLEAYSQHLIYNPLFSLRMAASIIRHRINADYSCLPLKHKNIFVLLFLLFSIPFGYLKSKRLI